MKRTTRVGQAPARDRPSTRRRLAQGLTYSLLQGGPLADVARAAIILRTGQLPYGGWGRRAFVGLGRGLFRRAHLAHYRELHPGSAFERVGSWIAPVAAARLYEGIAGESEALRRMLRSVLFTWGAAPVVNETGPGTRRRR